MKAYESFRIKDLELKNRLVMPPMCMYCAPRSRPTDFHRAHYGARALGGVGLVIMEATAVLPEGRISDNCLGLWSDDQVTPLADLVGHIHALGARAGIQIGHAGRKCGAAEETLYAPSALDYSDDGRYRTPKAMTQGDIDRTVAAFAAAAGRALAAGFDVVEVHGAHGYLVNQFLSPLSNHRTDGYGGTMEGRSRFLREVLAAVRTEWPKEKPLFLRVSAEDYADGGMTSEQMVAILRGVTDWVDVVHVSSGGVTPVLPPVFPGYQAAFSETIRRGVKLPTVAVGLITTMEMVEEILGNGRADLVALGRELLRNPFFPLTEARRLGIELPWPEQYRRAFL
ncbi:MAG TPA: NADPH dehydrogenase NamA [Synergistaceae bacterium]|nr:NADPH dehydrogenase NamA [Synergistaceae bacterium]